MQVLTRISVFEKKIKFLFIVSLQKEIGLSPENNVFLFLIMLFVILLLIVY